MRFVVVIVPDNSTTSSLYGRSSGICGSADLPRWKGNELIAGLHRVWPPQPPAAASAIAPKRSADTGRPSGAGCSYRCRPGNNYARHRSSPHPACSRKGTRGRLDSAISARGTPASKGRWQRQPPCHAYRCFSLVVDEGDKLTLSPPRPANWTNFGAAIERPAPISDELIAKPCML